MTEKELIAALKQDNAQALKKVYLEYRSPFRSFAMKYRLQRADILDIYQDAIIALRYNAMMGKLDDLDSSLKTYLFSIGKYMIYQKLKEHRKRSLVREAVEAPSPELPPYLNLYGAPTEEQRRLQTAFARLGPQCRELLRLFYFRGFSLGEIADAMKYRSKDVVKSQKSRCLRSLKTLIKNC